MSHQPLDEFQQQALDAFTRQQDAYLELVREWRRNAAASNVSAAMPTIPTPAFPASGEASSPADFAAQQLEFYARIVEQQQRFIASLNDILGSGR